MRRPLICAHRGASADHADNSADAFAAAIAAGADLVETDIRRGPDGTLVLSHDAVRPGEEPIPLTALLDLALRRVGLDLELKEPGLERGRAGAARPEHRERLIVTSFLPEVMAEFRRLDATLDLGLLVEDGPDYVLPPDLLAAVRACGADFLAPGRRGARPGHPARGARARAGAVGVDGQRARRSWRCWRATRTSRSSRPTCRRWRGPSIAG